MKIGFLAMSAKPFHKGHLQACKFAAGLVDILHLCISEADRKRKGEISILGKNVKSLWGEQFQPLIPDNVVVGFYANPLSAVYDFAVNETASTSCIVFAGEEDMERCYGEQRLEKAAPQLSIDFVPLPRFEGVSGTAVRRAMAYGDRATFAKLMPQGIDLQKTWTVLMGR